MFDVLITGGEGVTAIIALYQVADAVIDCPYIEITAEGLTALEAYKKRKARQENDRA